MELTSQKPAVAPPPHRLRVNADDFGLHPDLNRAIAAGVEAGRIHSLSVSVNGGAVDWPLLQRLRDQGVRIGLHLTWVGEAWLTGGGGFRGWPALATALARSPGLASRLELEARQQVAAFRAQDFAPAHLDSHQHVHVWPRLWTFTQELALENEAALRVPWCPTWRGVRHSPGGMALQAMAAFRRRQTPEAWPCIGLAFSGHYTLALMARELRAAQGQDLEVVVHPGYTTKDLQQHYPLWNYDWDAERLMVMDKGWPALLVECGYRFG